MTQPANKRLITEAAVEHDVASKIGTSGELDAALHDAIGGAAVLRWAPDTTVASGELRIAPDGSMLQRNSSGTSRASFDSTEKAAWTAIETVPGTISQTAMAAAISSAIAAAGSNLADTGYDVVLLLGQSNMQGDSGGSVTANLDVTSSRIWTYGATGTYASQIVQASDPLAHQGGSSVVGPAMAFARWYSPTMYGQRQLLLVPSAYNGTAFGSGTNRWDPTRPNDGTNLYENAVQQCIAALAAAGPNARLVAILWVQGESDALAGMSSTTYRTYLESLIDGMRSRLSTPDVPFLIGSMTPEFIAANGSPAVAIDTAHQQIPTRKPYTAYIAGPSGMGRGDNLHYSPVGQREQGRRLATALRTALANVHPANEQPANPPAPPAPVAPGAPTGLSGVFSGSNVNLSWTAPASNGGAAITGYKIYRSTTSGAETLLATTSTTATAYTDTSTSSGTYYYKVAAINSVGTGAQSSEATVTSAPTATDTFTRANSTTSMGTTETGSLTWAALQGTWGINSNQAYQSTNTSHAVATVDIGSANHYAEAVISTADSGSAVVVRCTDANNWVALLVATTGPGLYRNVGGTISSVSLSSGSISSLAVGQTLRVDMRGSTGTISQNGTAVATFTNSDTGTKVGFHTDTNTSRFDNFAASN